MIYMIYLAAGRSGHCDSNKLLEIVDGKPQYRHLLDILKIMKEEEPHRYELVVATDCEEIETAVKELSIKTVRSKEQGSGLSHLMQLGLKKVGEIGQHDHVMFAAADQADIQEDELFGFIHMYKRSYKGIGCLNYDGAVGNPIIFQGKFVPELLELAGDHDGWTVAKEHLQEIFSYEV